MNTKMTLTETVHVRLTTEQQTLLEVRAAECGLTLSEWARQTLLDTLGGSPMEHRLMNFIAAETTAIRISLEEWQQGRHLTEASVQERIERLATGAALERAKATASRLTVAKRENGETA